jgi:4-hydroxythreonine-4-phosphate dehydrogenase
MESKPSRVIAITLGDAAGIGPEVARAALASGQLDADFSYRLVGEKTGAVPGRPTRATAEAALAALENAVGLARAGDVCAVVTGPVSKQRMHEVGFPFPGQTEFFADRCGVADFAMCLTGGALTVALVTAHVPLRDVPGLLRATEIVRVGRCSSVFWRCGSAACRASQWRA